MKRFLALAALAVSLAVHGQTAGSIGNNITAGSCPSGQYVNSLSGSGTLACAAPATSGGSSAVGAPGYVQAAGTSGAFAATLPVGEFDRLPKPEMFSWLAAYNNCASQVCYVTALTDSRGTVWSGDGSGEGPTNASQRYLDVFSASILSNPKIAWHGTGLVYFNKFLVPGSPNPDNQYYTGVSGFTANNASSYDTAFGPAQTNPTGGASYGVTAVFSGGGFTFTTSSIGKSVDTVRMMCVTGAGMGTWTVNVNTINNGSTLATITCGGGSGAKAASYVASSTFTSQQINANATCSGTCELAGMEASVGATGFELNRLSSASAAAAQYTTNSTAFAYVNALPATSLLFTDYGTNDSALGYTATQYGAAISAIDAHFKTQSTNPSIINEFPPVSNNSTTPATYQQFAATGLTAAQANGAAWENIEDSWGAVYTSSLFGSDGIHPNALGSQLEANLLYATAMDLASTMSATTTATATTIYGTPSASSGGGSVSFAGTNQSVNGTWQLTDKNFVITFTPSGAIAASNAFVTVNFGKTWYANTGYTENPICVFTGIGTAAAGISFGSPQVSATSIQIQAGSALANGTAYIIGAHCSGDTER